MENTDAAAVLAAAEEVAGGQPQGQLAPGEVRLSTGVVLRVHAVPKTAFLALGRNFPEPVVPIWHNPEKGRNEENPSDPDYVRKMKDYKAAAGTAAIHIMLLLGTEMASAPAGFPLPDDAAWLEARALMGLSSGDGARARYLDWLLYQAAPADSDLKALALAVGRATGTAEADVQEALKSAGRDSE